MLRRYSFNGWSGRINTVTALQSHNGHNFDPCKSDLSAKLLITYCTDLHTSFFLFSFAPPSLSLSYKHTHVTIKGRKKIISWMFFFPLIMVSTLLVWSESLDKSGCTRRSGNKDVGCMFQKKNESTVRFGVKDLKAWLTAPISHAPEWQMFSEEIILLWIL